MPAIDESSRKWWVLAAMGAILGVILLDETVVGVALPTIQVDLDMSEVVSHWVVNIYMLVLAGLAAAAGKLGDIVGHKALMNTGLAIFGLASLACGFAESDVWLIAARGVQGVGAAIIFPSSVAMVTIAFLEEQRGVAIGTYGAVGTVFLALGPFVGGFLTDVASWRWIFWINPPVVLAVALIVLVTWIEPPRSGETQRIDWIGLVLLVGGLSMVIFGTMEGPVWGWANPAIISVLAAGAVLLVAFVFVERRRAAPLIEVNLFANPTFAACNLIMFTAQYSKMALFVFGALFLEDILKMTPLVAGAALLPAVVPQPFLAPFTGSIADRFGARGPSLAGLLLLLGGLVFVWAGVASGSYTLMFPGLTLWGLSMCFLFVPTQRAVMNAVPPQKQGQAGGISMSSQLLGSTVGMAVCSTLFLTTNDFQVVYLVNGAFALVVLVVSWLAIERGTRAASAAAA